MKSQRAACGVATTEPRSQCFSKAQMAQSFDAKTFQRQTYRDGLYLSGRGPLKFIFERVRQLQCTVLRSQCDGKLRKRDQYVDNRTNGLFV